MRKSIVLLAMATGIAAFAAQTAKEIKKVPVSSTRADSGTEMFKAYCATCHGLDATGGGPAADALKTAPPDLTLLKQQNGGKFPSDRVMHVIAGADGIGAHGSSDMPLWGPIFRSVHTGDDNLEKLRISNLTKYIASLQK